MAGKVTMVVDDTRLVQMIQNMKPTEPVRILADGVDYGIDQEFGTSRRAAHPFMVPAIEYVRPAYDKGFGQIQNLEHAEAFVEKLARDAERKAKTLAPVLTGNLKSSIHVVKGEEFTHTF